MLPPRVLQTALEPQGDGLQESISSTTAAAEGGERGQFYDKYLCERKKILKNLRRNFFYYYIWITYV